ncbi:30S ribosomal protein S6 [Mycoplasmopsis lipofaciens]|uniref:30S ribosomal protein S6 n=1 Tax=Mycoplasmopsis lipofaciens TaxID=114884 RepID=UPI0004858E1D|nr:30S ribosomal protein S6 [Mycoplasmopsis lipofaciens]
MNKYEIMLILDPKADAEVAYDLVESVFKKTNVKKAQKLERTDLAYKINKSNKAQYFLFNINSESKNIAEFTRRSNILKEVWRYLVINLDTETGYGKEKKEYKGKRIYNQQRAEKMRLKKEAQEASGNEEKPRRRTASNDVKDVKSRTSKVQKDAE